MSFRVYGSRADEASPPRPITSLETWREYRWSQGSSRAMGRTSKRLRARARVVWRRDRSVGPEHVLVLSKTHPRLHGLELVEGYAELKTGLRGERGGERNHDLLLVGHTPTETVVIGIEAKADETFDKTVAERWEEARETIEEKKQPTNWPKRLARLSPAILGVEATTSEGVLNPEIGGVAYQLLSALSGTLIKLRTVAHSWRSLSRTRSGPPGRPTIVSLRTTQPSPISSRASPA